MCLDIYFLVKTWRTVEHLSLMKAEVKFTKRKCSDCKKYSTDVEKYIQITVLWPRVFWFCRLITRNFSGCLWLNLYTIKLAFPGMKKTIVDFFQNSIKISKKLFTPILSKAGLIMISFLIRSSFAFWIHHIELPLAITKLSSPKIQF